MNRPAWITMAFGLTVIAAGLQFTAAGDAQAQNRDGRGRGDSAASPDPYAPGRGARRQDGQGERRGTGDRAGGRRAGGDAGPPAQPGNPPAPPRSQPQRAERPANPPEQSARSGPPPREDRRRGDRDPHGDDRGDRARRIARDLAIGIIGSLAARGDLPPEISRRLPDEYRPPRYRDDYDDGYERWTRRCRRLEWRCDDGSEWACRRLYRLCY